MQYIPESHRRYDIRVVTPQDQGAIRDLIHDTRRVHRHLDWLDESTYLTMGPAAAAYTNEKPAAVLACTPEAPGTAWIRIFAVHPGVSPSTTLRILLDATASRLREQSVHTTAVMVLADWFNRAVSETGFRLVDHVVFLELDLPSHNCLAVPDLHIRPFLPQDLEAIQHVDQEAFSSIWRHSLFSLESAVHRGSYVTVYESGTAITGYQISSQNAFGAHLARLAVLPEAQGRGVGTSLVQDLLDHFSRTGLFRITVNTQGQNASSLHLYEKLGFLRSNLQYPVYTRPLQTDAAAD